MSDYQALKDWAYELQLFGIKLGLSSTQALLARLGDPQRDLLAVHLAGSNGKGSTAAMMAKALEAAGYKVGLYTSPHLVSFRERFLINGRRPAQDKLARYMARVREVCDEGEPPTFFEFTTALAFLYFQGEGVEAAVIETGLGGRLDATNIIQPRVSLITSISLEHTQYLGRTLAQVASEKAGIIKPATPVASQALVPVAARVVAARAAELKAPLFRLGREFTARWSKGGMRYKGLSWDLEGLKIALIGRHQRANAALALVGLELLSRAGLVVPETAIRRGLAEVAWPGRLQTISQRPRVILDGAHNPGAAKVLAQALAEVRPARGRGRLWVVIGCMADKDYRTILRIIGPAADELIVTRAAYDRSATPERLAAAADSLGLTHRVMPELLGALALAKAEARDEDVIVVTGSLFVVGEVLAGLNIPPFPEEG